MILGMAQPLQKKTLYDAYRFPGFTPVRELKGVFGDKHARIIRLNRRSKKLSAVPAAQFTAVGTTASPGSSATFPAEIFGSTSRSTSAASTAGNARP